MALQPGLVSLLQISLLELRNGRLPSSAVLSLLLSKVTFPTIQGRCRPETSSVAPAKLEWH